MKSSLRTMNFSMLLLVLTLVLHFKSLDAENVVKDNNSLQHNGSARTLQAGVIQLELYNANTDTKITNLFNGMVIDMGSIPDLTNPDFSINVITSGPVTSILFGYNNDTTFRSEKSAPYAMCGNNGNNFYTCPVLGYGNHKVTATPIVNGIAGVTVTINFSITNTIPVPVPIPVPSPVAVPISAPTPVVVTPAITGLRLMYTGVSPSTYVQDLNFDSINVIDLRLLSLPTDQFNIDVMIGSSVQSVTFSNGRTETSFPLAYCGNSGNNFFTCSDLKLNTNVTITITAHAEKYGNGAIIAMKSITIQIIRSTPPIAPTSPIPVPVPSPIRPPVAGCPIPRLLGNWDGVNSKNATVRYPIQVAEAQGAMIGNDFIITSGFKGGYSSATPETYALDMMNPNAQWRRMDDMPFPIGLTHLGVAIKGMKGYFCGGYIGGSLGIHNGSCFEYDHSKLPGTGQSQWTRMASIPDGGRSGGGMIYDTTYDVLIYSAGAQRPKSGSKSAIDYNTTWMYSFQNPMAGWVAKSSIPFLGNHMNFVTAYDSYGIEHHYFFGGQSRDNEETGNTNLMYEYNVSNDTWIRRQNLPYPLGHAAATARAISCGFIVAGGRTNTGLTSEILYYDISSNTWTKIGDLTHKIHTNVCVIANNNNNSILRCETGWATGTFSWKRSITV